MKKFKNGDIIYNAIKTYPKVRFFVNSGSVYYNNRADTEGNAVIFALLPTTSGYIPPGELDCNLLKEDGFVLLTEDSENLVLENCPGSV